MAASHSRRFCQALLEETRGEVLRWATIDSVADRLGMDPDKAAVLAAELDEQGMVRVGGGHSVWLTEAGRQLVKTPAARHPSKPRQGKHRRRPAR
jgi:Mn-dependent DtxR family transcriptional regulator